MSIVLSTAFCSRSGGENFLQRPELPTGTNEFFSRQQAYLLIVGDSW